MSPIKSLSYRQRARLLFTLFPDELPGFVAHCHHFILFNYQRRDLLRDILKVPQAVLDSWFILIQHAQVMLSCESTRLARSPRASARLLFAGQLYPFAVPALHDYASSMCFSNPAFFHMVRAMF